MALERLTLPKEIKEKITAPLRQELIKQREGGGKKMLSYLSGSTITDMLNDAFGYMWSWKADREWVTESVPYFNQYSKAPDSQKVTNPITGKVGAWENQGPVAHVVGTLVVYLKNGPQMIPIEKSGYGSKSILGKQNDQESIFKAAGTDALKKAASLLGIGLELYRDEDEANYFYELNYEDPWTESALTEHAEDVEFIKKYKEDYKVSEDDFMNYVYELTGDSYDITPDNITGIVNEIKTQLGA